MSLEDVVNVQISRQTAAVSQSSFATVMILGSHKAFAERIRFYSNLKGVAEDFDVTDKEYLAATTIFSQSPSLAQIAIGRRDVSDVYLTVGDIRPLTAYSVKLNGTSYSFTTADTSPTVSEVVNGLIASINAATATHKVNALAVGSDATQIHLQSTDANTSYSLAVSKYMTVNKSYVSTSDIATDLNKVQEADDSWYGLVCTTRDPIEQLKVAEWTEAQKKMFGCASSDVNIASTASAEDTTTLAAKMKAAGYARTFLFYHPYPDEYVEAGMFGVNLIPNPGSNNWMFKKLASVTVAKFTQTQQNNLRNKHVNFYIELGGVPITFGGGCVVDGEFCDIIIGCDWLQARITEYVFSTLVNNAKLPFTDAGIATIGTQIKTVMKIAIANGFIADSPAPEIRLPKAINVPFNDKARRELNGITFKAILQGAINAISIQGTVTL